jgi:sterol desaturase/sphingolipid hydroxylase (fatty acid hydroxylase superfamily)
MEGLIRLSAFLGMFGLVAAAEAWRPRRVFPDTRARRWPINLGLAALNTLALRLLAGGALLQTAQYAESRHWGLLNVLEIPTAIKIILTLLALDFAIYAQHIASHKLPILWRLHQVHHTDLGFDVTTAVRFHPLEILLSLVYKLGLILLLGADPWASVAFEIVLNSGALFNHGNVFIPEHIDRWLRWLLITPDMHRIHHSAFKEETDSNYGFSVSWWDRLCRTYKAEPRGGQQAITIGLTQYRQDLDLTDLLSMPFRSARTP